jgi:hypothetical protein
MELVNKCMELPNQRLKGLMQNSFKSFIRHAIEHALADNPTDNDVLQVIVNMQASLELLSKLYVLQYEGWKGIVEQKFQNKTEIEILKAIDDGSMKTTPFWKHKEFVAENIYLNDDDVILLDGFQNLRNQVMHLGVINPSKDILNEAIWFMVRIISQLDWQDTLPMRHQYMSNSLKVLIGPKLYDKLINNSCYVCEAVDRAYDVFDEVKHCIQCGNEAWGLNNGYWMCLVCGYRGDEDTFGFIDCPSCSTEKELVYDALNIDVNEFLDAKCCSCGKLIPVWQCPTCENVYVYPSDCEFCEDEPTPA